MRVTNTMMVNNLMRNLYKNYSRMDRSQQMLASQKKFLRPSDDPIGVTRSLRLTTEILNMEQYKRNVDDSDSWILSSEQVVKNMMEVMQRIRELTVQGSNETYSLDDRKKIADEISELKDQLIGLGNTAYAGSYLFSGYKTDKPLLNKDGTYDLDGGILSIAESIDVNVGISDRMGINFIGQRLYGHMATTSYDEYVLRASGTFEGAEIEAGEEFRIQYNETDYTITMPEDVEYKSFQASKFVKDLNEAIANSTPPGLEGLVTASLEDGVIVFKGAREFQIISAGTSMDVKDVMGIDTDTDAVLEKVIVSDYDDIDNPVSQGAGGYLLKASGGFTATSVGGFKIFYGDFDYTIEMDRLYGINEKEEFIYDFNKKLAEINELAGHVMLSEKDGKMTITADKKFRLADGFSDLGFEDTIDGSGMKSIRTQYGLEGSELKLMDEPITIDTGDSLYFTYGGKNYTLPLVPKEYDGTPGNTFDDLINDIQGVINGSDLKGYVSVTGKDGRIQFSADSEFELRYGAKAEFSGSFPLVIGSGNDKLDIRLGTGSPVTINIENGTYADLDGLTKAIQTAIDSDMYTRGRISVSNDGTDITFYSVLPFELLPTEGSNFLSDESSSDKALMDSLGFNTSKKSLLIDKRVESGSATQLIGVLDKLIEDLYADNTEGIEKALTRLDNHVSNLNAVRAEMGVKTNRLELTKNRIEDDYVNIRGLLSKNEDIDMAEILMKLQMDTNVYNASLSVGSKVITLSLVDFLR